MKKLLLLRHAKSSWDDPNLSDFDRPLAPRGRQAAPRMGREIARRGWTPAMALVSPALRTRQTWDLVAAELTGKPAVSYHEALYEVAGDTLLEAIRRTPERVGDIVLVGHNPGMEELAAALAGSGSAGKALGRMAEKFPTGALARFEFDGAWATLKPGTARLTHFLRPKDLTPA
ncbi:histidine phosphatase family protein [Mesorhizobium sp. ZMM04-5]|uniref:Histidine phosphatase family protein n=1 Tax=Mesorhizobium marinum TaxID=3228790 RepID=A0ABV3R2X8_9HYPH